MDFDKIHFGDVGNSPSQTARFVMVLCGLWRSFFRKDRSLLCQIVRANEELAVPCQSNLNT